jgi:AcrR family transcriptional regulator
VIEKLAPKPPARRKTRAEQSAERRANVIQATIDCLVEDGYSELTTRRIAERAGIAQSTLMHHFPSREGLLADAVTQLALELAEHAVDEIDVAALRIPSRRDAVLDQAWAEFTSPEALAVGQLWVAAWTEPDLAGALVEVQRRLSTVIVGTAAALFPSESSNEAFLSLVDLAVSTICGLITAIPITGREAVDARWQALKPLLLQTAAGVLD